MEIDETSVGMNEEDYLASILALIEMAKFARGMKGQEYLEKEIRDISGELAEKTLKAIDEYIDNKKLTDAEIPELILRIYTSIAMSFLYITFKEKTEDNIYTLARHALEGLARRWGISTTGPKVIGVIPVPVPISEPEKEEKKNDGEENKAYM